MDGMSENQKKSNDKNGKIEKNPLTDGIVLPSEDSLGECGVLVIGVQIGTRTPTGGSLAPSPVPVCVVVRRVVRIRLAVRVVAEKSRVRFRNGAFEVFACYPIAVNVKG